MELVFGDPLGNFPVEIIEHQDADEIDGAPSDGDGQALAQGALDKESCLNQ